MNIFQILVSNFYFNTWKFTYYVIFSLVNFKKIDCAKYAFLWNLQKKNSGYCCPRFTCVEYSSSFGEIESRSICKGRRYFAALCDWMRTQMPRFSGGRAKLCSNDWTRIIGSSYTRRAHRCWCVLLWREVGAHCCYWSSIYLPSSSRDRYILLHTAALGVAAATQLAHLELRCCCPGLA